MYVEIVWDNIADGKSDQFETFRCVSYLLGGKYLYHNLEGFPCGVRYVYVAKKNTVIDRHRLDLDKDVSRSMAIVN